MNSSGDGAVGSAAQQLVDWQPEPQKLSELLELLRKSQAPDTEVQQGIDQKLQEFNQFPDVSMYLTFVLARLTAEDDAVRALSGILLKKNIRSNWRGFSITFKEFIMEECIRASGDSSDLIRRVAGGVIAAIIIQGELKFSLGFIHRLSGLLDSPHYFVCLGALIALVLMWEDSDGMRGEDLEQFAHHLPKYIALCGHEKPEIRARAMACVYPFIGKAGAFMNHIDPFLKNLFILMSVEKNARVRTKVCEALVALLASDVCVERLMPEMHKLIEYMLKLTEDSNEEVALSACDFWTSVSEQPMCKEMLAAHLPQVVETLLRCMKYTESDVIALEESPENDEMIPDHDEDLAPVFHKSKDYVQGQPTCDSDDEDLAPNDEVVDDDEDFLFELDFRISAADGLQALGTIFPDEVFDLVLPSLKSNLVDENWVMKECGIFVLYSIAKGCMDKLGPHLPELIPFLLDCLAHSKVPVRFITCYTLSKFFPWIVREASEQGLKHLVVELLKRVLDVNKRVQKFACYAFAKLEEAASTALVPLLGLIMEAFEMALGKYQRRNLRKLYHVIGTLAESVGHHMNRPDFTGVLMPLLISKWNDLRDEDEAFFSLSECLSSIAIALQDGFLPYALPVYTRCVSLIEQILQQSIANQMNPEEVDAPNKDFLEGALDLLSNFVQGLKCHAVPFVANSNLLPLLYNCMRDPEPEVRADSCSVLGELAKSCYELLIPHIADFLPMLCSNINLEYPRMCQNATWATGELAVQMGDELKAYVGVILEKLVEIVSCPSTPEEVLENGAVTLGRIGAVCSHEVAPSLGAFIRPWCEASKLISDANEKDSAFRGICSLVMTNPIGVIPEFVALCDAIVSYENAKDDVKEMFHRIIHGFKNEVMAAEQWDWVGQQLKPDVKEQFTQLYGF